MNRAATSPHDAPLSARVAPRSSGRSSTSTSNEVVRRSPIGAELLAGRGTHFRVWAPRHEHVAVELVLDGRTTVHPLVREPTGYFSGLVAEAHAGSLYRYRLPHGAFPDPASRFQPEGPHGPSQVIDPAFAWTDAAWRGRPPTELVLYELHLGTFTPAGTWRAAAGQLSELARLGVTAIEIMPVSEFPGAFGWGYDGVDPFAPTRLYGLPDEARAFVDEAHREGLMVILDVVYNHLGPDGCYVREFSPYYFTDKYECEWGDPLNFDGEHSGPVREFFIANARYWIEEFHFDGLRLDATQQIFDASPTHLVADVVKAVRSAAPGRHTFVVAENETQEARLLQPPDRGGWGLDAVWNDDFHHSATVAATGKTEAYYSDYRGTAQELVSACKRGFLFQGQWSRWQQKRRGSPVLDVSPQHFVLCLQNHDQVANSLTGQRLHEQTSPGRLRALTALQLLAPSIPMLFQGQEFAASAPFLYFADHKPDLAALVAQGRRQFLSQFRSVAAEAAASRLADCCTVETYQRCKLDLSERERHVVAYQLHQDLLQLRRDEPTFRDPMHVDGAVLDPHAFVLRFFGRAGDDRLLIVNLDATLPFNPAPEPLLAPPADQGWRVLWSSESPRYGGGGTPALETTDNWIIPGPAAFAFSPDSNRELPRAKTSEKN